MNGYRFLCGTAILAMGSLAVPAACSSHKAVGPSPELAQARLAYVTAQEGPAAQFAPVDLQAAKAALDHARSMSRSDPWSADTRTQAYLALRRAQTADANGAAAQAAAMRAEADRAAVPALTAIAGELQRTRRELAQSETKLHQQHQLTSQALSEFERQGRVREEAGGRVIALPAAALFATGKSDLAPGAKSNLDRIAHVLQTMPDQHVRVEGFTDDTGSDPTNEQLSGARAQAVRIYLVSRGVDPSRIEAAGHGSQKPIASNKTAEGRASNRRVEIAIERMGVTEPMPSNHDQRDKP